MTDNIFSRITKGIGEKVTKVKDATWEKIDDLTFQTDAQAQTRFLGEIMKDEGCTFEEAVGMVTVGSPNWQPKYSLGYKMASPAKMAMMAMGEKGKAAFKKELVPEELALFEGEVENMNIGKEMIAEHHRQKQAAKKAKKEAKKAARQRAAGLEVKAAKKQK